MLIIIFIFVYFFFFFFFSASLRSANKKLTKDLTKERTRASTLASELIQSKEIQNNEKEKRNKLIKENKLLNNKLNILQIERDTYHANVIKHVDEIEILKNNVHVQKVELRHK
jgi:hypothetical protein